MNEDKWHRTDGGKAAQRKYADKIVRPQFKLDKEETVKALTKHGDIKTINARAKKLFLTDLEGADE